MNDLIMHSHRCDSKILFRCFTFLSTFFVLDVSDKTFFNCTTVGVSSNEGDGFLTFGFAMVDICSSDYDDTLMLLTNFG